MWATSNRFGDMSYWSSIWQHHRSRHEYGRITLGKVAENKLGYSLRMDSGDAELVFASNGATTVMGMGDARECCIHGAQMRTRVGVSLKVSFVGGFVSTIKVRIPPESY